MVLPAALAQSASPQNAAARQISGAGSTAAQPIYRAWAESWGKSGGVALEYAGVGSSAGLKRMAEGDLDFGASDVMPSADDVSKRNWVFFPTAVSGAVPVVNLPGVARGRLQLSGATLAAIYTGQISRWDDATIRAENAGLTLPALPIVRVVRKEGSGTSFHFSAYLAAVSPAFATEVGKASSSPKWPGEPVRAEGSKGIAETVAATSGAIGYVEFNWVERAKLNAVRVRNASGQSVAASTAAFRAAVLASPWMRGDFTAPLTNIAADSAWPITMPTYVVFPKRAARAQSTARAVDFFVWSFLHGDDLLDQSAFVRLPDRVQAKAFGVLLQVTDAQGVPLLKGLPMPVTRGAE
ncbi:hypothetical protein IP84_04420 [beta proteobacterium AAP99]|nr:hypothetical protein IP84_04420 [beta proteobacterium AAP99]